MQRCCTPALPAPHRAPSLRRLRRCRGAAAHSVATAAPRRELYPELPRPRSSGTLAVDAPHVLYWEEYGNAAGVPALVVHGGPGAGCFPAHARFFDPTHYRIVLLDQRGSGRSVPLGCLEHNNTDALVRDIEALREHLGVERWTLLGGSWGVALSLAYACAHPARVRALLLRGVCLMRRAEIDWAFRCGGGDDGLAGAAALFPGAWAAFTRALGVPLLCAAGGPDPVQVAFDALSDHDAERRAKVAEAWLRWGGVIGTPPSAKGVQAWDGRAWATLDGGDEAAGQAALRLAAEAAPKKKGGRKKAAPAPEAAAPAPSSAVPCPPMSRGEAQALLEAHYCLHEGFLTPATGGALLSRLPPLLAARVPAMAVHGRADALCPVASAYVLHTAWPALELRVVAAEGHSMYQRGIAHTLLTASDAFRALPR